MRRWHGDDSEHRSAVSYPRAIYPPGTLGLHIGAWKFQGSYIGNVHLGLRAVRFTPGWAFNPQYVQTALLRDRPRL